jgi:hypothetical protein
VTQGAGKPAGAPTAQPATTEDDTGPLVPGSTPRHAVATRRLLGSQVSVAYPQVVPSVTAKKKCCKDRPRCKKCPLVLKRLSDAGLAERLGERSDSREFKVDKKLPKKVLKAARAR